MTLARINDDTGPEKLTSVSLAANIGSSLAPALGKRARATGGDCSSTHRTSISQFQYHEYQPVTGASISLVTTSPSCLSAIKRVYKAVGLTARVTAELVPQSALSSTSAIRGISRDQSTTTSLTLHQSNFPLTIRRDSLLEHVLSSDRLSTTSSTLQEAWLPRMPPKTEVMPEVKSNRWPTLSSGDCKN